MVSVTAPANKELSISLKTKNKKKSKFYGNGTTSGEHCESLDMPSSENLVTDIKDDAHLVVPSPPKSSRTAFAVSPRTSLARTRRQPHRFKDYGVGDFNKSPRKKRTANDAAIVESNNRNEDLINNNISLGNSDDKNEKTTPKKANVGKAVEKLQPIKKNKAKKIKASSPSEQEPAEDSVKSFGRDAERAQHPTDVKVFEEGSLLWAKVFAHPYWPCMVCPDPETGMLHKPITVAGHKGQVASESQELYSYHVRFFGPKYERSWTNPKVTDVFEGGKRYLENLEQMLTAAKNESHSGHSKKKKRPNVKTSIVMKQYGIKVRIFLVYNFPMHFLSNSYAVF